MYNEDKFTKFGVTNVSIDEDQNNILTNNILCYAITEKVAGKQIHVIQWSVPFIKSRSVSFVTKLLSSADTVILSSIYL
jgi:hemolysin-activating ACP:hemolysin acyltransferase